jgi:hypothetical protein
VFRPSYANACLFHRLSTSGVQGLFVLYPAGDCFHYSVAATEVQQGDTHLADDKSKTPFRIVWKYASRGSMIRFVVSVVGVIVFVGLTACDTQRIKALYLEPDTEEFASKKAILGALSLGLHQSFHAAASAVRRAPPELGWHRSTRKPPMPGRRGN